MQRSKVVKILVTGALGAVGSPLTDELERRGHDVWACDVGHSSTARYVRCDVGDFRELASTMDRVQPEFVYHLGAEFGRRNGEDYYERLWHANAIGTKNMLRMQEQQYFRMLFTSSSEVYGDWDGLMEEEVLATNPIRQMNDYAITKWVNEMQIMNSADRFGTETVRVRLFNTYGPGEYYCEYRSVICQFVYRALHDLPYTVYLKHHRTSSYITDTVRTLANACEPQCFKPGEVYNIAGTEYHDIKSISDTILGMLNKTDKLVEYRDLEAHNTKDKQTTAERAVRDLDHQCTVSLAEGIENTIKWQSEVYGCG
jgi:dTDP-glucose 4,6-dehydratase